MQAIQAKLKTQVTQNEKALGKLLKMAPSLSKSATPSVSTPGTPSVSSAYSSLATKTEEPKEESMLGDKVGTIKFMFMLLEHVVRLTRIWISTSSTSEWLSYST